ncbi:hypothetical protein A3J33_02365 [candidate division WWE3 bacterium RIFCSPLOWO2_02_FULL_53_10]|uniref:Prepilin-type N-terminal cleavage/methylation domain-containing protein n=1 Tax=candidate division WWE3 bacterium RIFCSPLOWO2_02_FULL_53_10 TaxID=1802629 RepID=A0A1F4WPX4_UNCKA|nr:MAG: hypothetical protein A3J33_02365 [candidate division WWE3 bacterium RIFCSPLOWO2_02_FULL_53_10]
MLQVTRKKHRDGFISERNEETKLLSHRRSGFIFQADMDLSAEQRKSLNVVKGFTLIELLLYLGIATLIISTVSIFIYLNLQARVRSQVVAEVEQQGMQIMQIISQATRNAQTVNFPNQGDTDVYLDIKVPAPDNPTVFDLSGGAIRIKEGTGSATPLTSSRVIASSLTFHNMQKAVKIQFTLTYSSSSTQATYVFSKIFYGSAMVRTP